MNPGALEICDSGIDEDCDGLIDDADPSVSGTTFYADTDADGFGDASSTVVACTAPAGFVATSDECDDADSSVNPVAIELPGDGIDQDCDGADGVADTAGDTAGDTSGDTAADSGADSASGDSGPTEDDKSPGCGCTSSPAPSWAPLLALVGLLHRRRRWTECCPVG